VFTFFILTGLLLLSSCEPTKGDIDLDELQDRMEYTGGMIVVSETYMGEKIKKIVLNNRIIEKPESLDLRSPGYYRIEIYTGKRGAQAAVIRTVVLDPLRGDSEWGLPAWTPKGLNYESIGKEVAKLIYTSKVPANLASPFVVIIGDDLCQSNKNIEAELGAETFLVKRGGGSAWIQPSGATPTVLRLDQQSMNIEKSPFETSPLILSGKVSVDLQIPDESYVNISEDLSIAQGVTLSVGAGSYLTIDEGVNIYNQGKILIEGSEELPVTVSSSNDHQLWGGIIGTGTANTVEASYTLFSKSGYYKGGEYDYGHAHRQALFYCEYGSVSLDHCYMIDHAGQVFYPVLSSMDISHCLVQRAITGGQANSSNVLIDHSVFTDFPDDRLIYQDKDNDCFYLMQSDARISNSVFMYAADDGLDSGGSGGGTVEVSNTRFETIFHEGAALSSGEQVSKNHIFINCTFLDCGQGLELGYSSPNHQVNVDSCSFIGNAVGIRYGDNYTTPHGGHISVTNSQSLDNTFRDVWNMLRNDWSADTASMSFNNVRVSRTDPLYPQLEIYE